MSPKRQWPHVPEVLDRAARVENMWVGNELTVYRDRESGAVVKVHRATVRNLLRTLMAAGWSRHRDGVLDVYERPRPVRT